MGTLYLVSTPIGNLEDMTLRALRVLRLVDYVLCEDTRETGKLLKVYRDYQFNRDDQESQRECMGYGIKSKSSFKVGERFLKSAQDKAEQVRNDEEEVFPKLVSYNDYNREKRIPWVIGEMDKGKNVALVADRGTPLVSDPGYKLVREVISMRLKLEAVPGVSAVLAALVVSGLPPDKFMFVGFLPKKSGARKKLFGSLPQTTIVAYEAPYRLLASLKDLKEALGEVKLAVCVELTKMHERIFRGGVTEVIKELESKGRVKGEVTVVFRKLYNLVDE